MHFNIIKIDHWQQFENIDIDLDNRLTILTGANGSGKTSILSILAKHSNWQNPSFSTPQKEKESGIIKFFTRYFNGKDKSDLPQIGQLSYSNGQTAKIQTQDTASAEYHLQINGQQGVNCFFVPSHRSAPKYKQVTTIPMAKKPKRQAFDEVYTSNRQRYMGEGNQSSSFMMKSALIGWAVQGYGSKVMPPDANQLQYFEGFPLVLKKVLPQSLGFEKLEIRNAEVVFICNGGQDEFILETVSGGIAALIDIAWQIYMYSTEEKGEIFTVIIDEIENHLHPSMQRQILGDLLEAFPSIRFIVSTHSPLIVGSVRDAKVYALIYNENKKVVSKVLDFKNKAKTATEVLDEVLGVSFTMPIWAERKLEEIVSNYSRKTMTEDEFLRMKKDLEDLGLERLIPSAITKILEEKND